MRRRIEITVYRRSTVVLYDQPEKESNQGQSLQGDLSEHIGVRSTGPVDQTDARLTTADINCAPELTLLIEALVKNDGNSNRAARQLGLSRSDFMSKLRGLGFSHKQ